MYPLASEKSRRSFRYLCLDNNCLLLPTLLDYWELVLICFCCCCCCCFEAILKICTLFLWKIYLLLRTYALRERNFTCVEIQSNQCPQYKSLNSQNWKIIYFGAPSLQWKEFLYVHCLVDKYKLGNMTCQRFRLSVLNLNSKCTEDLERRKLQSAFTH